METFVVAVLVAFGAVLVLRHLQAELRSATESPGRCRGSCCGGGTQAQRLAQLRTTKRRGR